MPTELKPSTDLSTGFVDNHYLSNYMSEVEKSCDNAHELNGGLANQGPARARLEGRCSFVGYELVAAVPRGRA